ncbi:hypothetical protein LIER_15489 [Lithospermum erythrorhizon]|uniref:Uncharacterized protein n=1 Tax=Lithospermum erythrorhizon TaxID=34254 RepID=A0AAV3Q7R8_LITER
MSMCVVHTFSIGRMLCLILIRMWSLQHFCGINWRKVICAKTQLPPGWKDFKCSLKYKKEDTSLEELAKYLRIEEDFRNEKSGKEHGVLVVGTGQSMKVNLIRVRKRLSFNIAKTSRRKLLVGFAMVLTYRGIFPKGKGVLVVRGLVKPACL